MKAAALPTVSRIRTAWPSGVEAVTAGLAPEAAASRSIALRVAAAVEGVARGGTAPLALLFGQPVCSVSTSTTGGSSCAADRSKKATPMTSVSQICRNPAAPGAVTFTPPRVLTTRNSPTRVGPNPATICRRTTRCAGEPPTIRVDVAAVADGLRMARPAAATATSARGATNRFYKGDWFKKSIIMGRTRRCANRLVVAAPPPFHL